MSYVTGNIVFDKNKVYVPDIVNEKYNLLSSNS